MNVQIPVRIQTGAPVRIDGKEYSAGPVISGGRVFYDKEAGTQIVLSEIVQMQMALAYRLRDDAPYQKLSNARKHTLRIDWGTFTPVERQTALMRALFVRKLDKVEPANMRAKKKIIHRIVEDVCKQWKIPLEKAPSARKVRTWYRIFVTAGRDVRALVPCNWAKGRREQRYPQWQIDEINRLINEKLAVPTPSSFRQVRLLANERLKKAAADRGEAPVLLGKRGRIGGNLLSRMLRERDKFEVLLATTNVREANRQAQSVQLGPQGNLVNRQWEVDHTLLDILVIDENTMQIAGRPWMTAIIDRYSRCIVGFSLSFAPPSWASVMDALRVAVMKKDWIIAGLGGIVRTWDCFGVPRRLITDHGRDFKSNSMEQAKVALDFELKHAPPRKPWFKGKIERWFRTLAEQIIHTIPGTVLSKWEDRKFYNSEEFAVLTIHEVNWIVAKWVIDVYHHTQHSKLGRTPAQAWAEGLHEIPLIQEPPADLLIPMTGLVVPRSLQKSGIRYMGLRWDSPAFARARAFLPDSANVKVRIDPLDISTAYVYDEHKEKWVEGQLVEPTEARGLSLNQWCTIAKLRRRIAEDDELSEQAALARAMEEIGQYVKERVSERSKGKAPMRFKRFVSAGSAWSAIRPERLDPSMKPPGSHTVGITPVKSPPLQPYAPFTDPKRRRKTVKDKKVSAGEEKGATGNGSSAEERPAEPAEQNDPAPSAATARPDEAEPTRVPKSAPKLKIKMRPMNYGGTGEEE
jgi:putative transposase